MYFSEVNYDNLAHSFDCGRALQKEKGDLWLALFRQHLRLDHTSWVLDVGCGTGRFAIPMASEIGCGVVGIDPSPAMLAEGMAKSSRAVTWLQGRAEALPLREGVFDACLASQVIHHFRDKYLALAEMLRVLKPGGRIGIRYSSHEQLRAILDYRFFPSALDIDLARVPAIDEVRELLRTVGLMIVEEYVVRQRIFYSPAEYLDKLRLKYASVLSLIPEVEFQRGLRAAEAYLAKRDPNARDAEAEVVFLVGIRL